MGTFLVTGSTDGIGLETGLTLATAGHRVVLHARNAERGKQAVEAVRAAAGVVIGDVSSLAQMREVARASNEYAPYDAVIHNVGVGGGAPSRRVTEDGFEYIFAVNVLAPYVLTALMPLPPRLVYLTSGLESDGRADLGDLQYESKPWDGMQAYRDSKLHDVMLAFAIARRHPDVRSNAVDPGWIKTRMGGPQATDELSDGAETQVWLATSDEAAAAITGRYLKRRVDLRANPAAYDIELQEALLATCAELSGHTLP